MLNITVGYVRNDMLRNCPRFNDFHCKRPGFPFEVMLMAGGLMQREVFFVGITNNSYDNGVTDLLDGRFDMTIPGFSPIEWRTGFVDFIPVFVTLDFFTFIFGIRSLKLVDSLRWMDIFSAKTWTAFLGCIVLERMVAFATRASHYTRLWIGLIAQIVISVFFVMYQTFILAGMIQIHALPFSTVWQAQDAVRFEGYTPVSSNASTDIAMIRTIGDTGAFDLNKALVVEHPKDFVHLSQQMEKTFLVTTIDEGGALDVKYRSRVIRSPNQFLPNNTFTTVLLPFNSTYKRNLTRVFNLLNEMSLINLALRRYRYQYHPRQEMTTASLSKISVQGMATLFGAYLGTVLGAILIALVHDSFRTGLVARVYHLFDDSLIVTYAMPRRMTQG